MTPTGQFRLAKRLADAIGEAEQAGIRIEVGDDFALYRSRRQRQPDRNGIYPMFDVASSFIDRTNGFWVCGFDTEGALVHTQAIRLLDLSGVTLGSHLATHRHKYITPDTTPDPEQTFYSGPDALNSITGSVCYHGEFWLQSRGLGGPRSQGVTLLLSRILLEIAVAAWTPSFIFALVPRRLAAKGAHLRYGYHHCQPGQWIGPDQQVTEEDYLIWLGPRDLLQMQSLVSQDAARARSDPSPQESHRSSENV